jgi:hypothetical protein
MKRAWPVALVVLAGCGGSGERAADPPAAASARQQVAAAVHGYLNGLADADGKQACAHLTRAAQADLTAATTAPTCEVAVGAFGKQIGDDARRRLRAARVTVGAVHATTATARLAGRNLPFPRAIPLRRDAGEWKIAGFEGDVHFTSPEDAQCISGGMNTFDRGTAPKYWFHEGRKDFRAYIVEVCRRAVRRGILDDPDAKRKIVPIARQVIREMVRRGQIKSP